MDMQYKIYSPGCAVLNCLMGILTGRRVTEGHEPRQIRKEAAISDIICVVD